MHEVVDCSIDLIIYDPPFTNSPDRKSLDKKGYSLFLKTTSEECNRVLSNEGVLVTINTDLRDHSWYNRNQKEYDGLIWHKHSDIKQMFENLGFRCFETKIWLKSLKKNIYRYNYSYIQFFVKSSKINKIHTSTEITTDFSPDVWFLTGTPRTRLPNNRVFRDGLHPSLVSRCISAFTERDGLVLSPFVGLGTVIQVAKALERSAIGYEVDVDLYDHLINTLTFAEILF